MSPVASFSSHAIRRLAGTRAVACARLAVRVAACVAVLATSAAAQTVSLFKIVTVRDDIVVGLSPEEAKAIGGADVTTLGRAIKDKGELTVWQYAVRKAPDGQLEQAPLRRVSIIGHDSLRVEPYATPLRVVAPQ